MPHRYYRRADSNGKGGSAVLNEFKRALARIQSDYGFYIDCQANPAVALAGYDLTADERSVLTNPVKLADLLRGGMVVNPMRITITISGRHDWVNRQPRRKNPSMNAVGDAMVAREVEAIKKANTSEERTEAAVRLMGLIG
jgi:hypothetical protein